MRPDELDFYIQKSLEVPDEGFTEALLYRLPSPKVKLFSRPQLLIWCVTAMVVFVIAMIGAPEIMLPTVYSGASLVVAVIVALLVFVHLEADTTG